MSRGLASSFLFPSCVFIVDAHNSNFTLVNAVLFDFVEKGPNGPKLVQIKSKFNDFECLITAVN